jgi:hypothetical protein
VGREIEFPTGSGQRAWYEDHEIEVMRSLTLQGEAGEITKAEVLGQVTLLHELKAILGARILTDKEQAAMGPLPTRDEMEKADPSAAELPEQVSLFGTPDFPVPSGVVAGILAKRAKHHDRDNSGGLLPPLTAPDFDGATYQRERDHARLFPQLLKVAEVMKDEKWHTSAEIVERTGENWASVSARLRDFRKTKFGGHVVDRRYVDGGLHEYRLSLNRQAALELGYGDPDIDD